MTVTEAIPHYRQDCFEVRSCADCPNAVVRRAVGRGSGWFHADEADGDACPGLGPVRPA